MMSVQSKRMMGTTHDYLDYLYPETISKYTHKDKTKFIDFFAAYP
jgi:hypothetical protein